MSTSRTPGTSPPTGARAPGLRPDPLVEEQSAAAGAVKPASTAAGSDWPPRKVSTLRPGPRARRATGVAPSALPGCWLVCGQWSGGLRHWRMILEMSIGNRWPRPGQAAVGALDHVPVGDWPGLAGRWLAAGVDPESLRQLPKPRSWGTKAPLAGRPAGFPTTASHPPPAAAECPPHRPPPPDILLPHPSATPT